VTARLSSRLRLLAVFLAALAAAWAAAPPAARAEAAGLTIAGGAQAHSLSRHLRYLADPRRALTIEDVADPATAARFRASPFTANEINFGYSGSAYWLALPLRLEPDAAAHWLLEIGYPSLDRVEVYAPRAGGGYGRQIAGDLQPFAERPYPHRHLVFPLELRPGAQTIYLRVESAGNLTIPATLWRPEALHRHDQKSYALLAVYYGMLLALGLYNLLLYFSTRERVFAAYVAFVACMAVGQASMNGFGNQFLWPEWPQWGHIALPSGMAATGFFGAVFTRVFLGTRLDFPRLDRVIVLLAAAFALAAAAPVFAPYRFAAIFTSVTGIAFSLTAVAGGLYCLRRGHPGARYFLLAWTLLLAGVAVLAMRNLGWVPTTPLTLHSMQIGSALEMLLLSFALADRINVMRREKEAASRDALDAREAMVETLRRSERELEARVSERTRDLEEANTRLRHKERELEHLARHDALTGLPNRSTLNERITQAIARAQRGGRAAAVLLIDLDGFKRVNDYYGHMMGDRLLVAVAERLKASVRATDAVTRYGGDEMVIVLEDLQGPQEAAQVADKLVMELNRPFELEQRLVQIGASIGVALYPRDAAAPAALLARADEAMYAAKAAGRGGWRAAAAG
jgi:diguanylate cyclase (GGDEF)-like protein